MIIVNIIWMMMMMMMMMLEINMTRIRMEMILKGMYDFAMRVGMIWIILMQMLRVTMRK
jgi:hypothetical protein